MYRSRKFLDLCRGSDCFLSISAVCNHNPETVVACHSNAQRHGHGTAIKSHDIFTVPGCSSCHFWLDASGHDKYEKQEVFRDAWERWILHLFSSGKAVVK